jgi:STE24 endopeptidase
MPAARPLVRIRSGFERSPALRIGAAAVAAVVVAEAAVWLLSPGGEVIDPAEVSEDSVFTPEQLERAESYREGQRLLALGGLAVEGAALGALALWRPPRLRRLLEAAARRPLLGGAAVGAGVSLAVGAAGLPLGAWAHERAVDVGLSTQDLGDWLADQGRYAVIGAAFAALGGAVAMALIRRLGRNWWAGGAVVVVCFAVLTTWLAPVAIAPLFNDFEELPPGPVRSDVLRLGERAGVEIGEVYEVDASRRSTGLNAYVNGLGPTKRVVLYDNLVRGEDRDVVASVVAHELAHVDGRDIARGIVFVAVVAPLGALFVQLLATGIARRRGDDPASPAVIPAVALALFAATLVIGVTGLQLSRRVEARADTFALRLTEDPRSFVELQKRLAAANVSDPDPPGWYRLLFGSHPTTLERVGAARAYGADRDG